MTVYEAWYARGPGLCPVPDQISLTHVKLRRVENRTLRGVWHDMQEERWSPEGRYDHLIRALRLDHVSMTDGDVIFDCSTREYHLVCDRGYHFRCLGTGNRRRM